MARYLLTSLYRRPGRGITTARFDRSPMPTVNASGSIAGDTYAIVEDDMPEDPPPPNRPPYQIPPLAEILATPAAGITAASTFSGGGGSSLGLRWAGITVAWASEFVPAARAVYEANMPGTHVDDRDIRQVLASDLLADLGMARGELDLLEGSPPCASFSTAGKRSEGWGQVRSYSDTSQRSDDLFLEFARLVDGVRPRAFLAENVTGLTMGVARGYLKEIVRELRAPGYRVGCRILDASWLGVPQARRRLILVGLRDDVAPGVAPPFPRPLGFQYTMADALGPTVTDGWTTKWDGSAVEPMRFDQPARTIMAGGIDSQHGPGKWGVHARDEVTHDPETGQSLRFDRMAIGAAYRTLQPGEGSDRYFNLIRGDPDRPAGTITQSGGGIGTASLAHPAAPRKFTLGELRRLCGFPDDFVLLGTYKQRWERLGRAVPPPMYRQVGRALLDVLA